jgi:hypothetical protein
VDEGLSPLTKCIVGVDEHLGERGVVRRSLACFSVVIGHRAVLFDVPGAAELPTVRGDFQR